MSKSGRPTGITIRRPGIELRAGTAYARALAPGRPADCVPEVRR